MYNYRKKFFNFLKQKKNCYDYYVTLACLSNLLLCTFVTAFIAEEENKKRQNPKHIVLFYCSQVNHFKSDDFTEFLRPKKMIIVLWASKKCFLRSTINDVSKTNKVLFNLGLEKRYIKIVTKYTTYIVSNIIQINVLCHVIASSLSQWFLVSVEVPPS